MLLKTIPLIVFLVLGQRDSSEKLQIQPLNLSAIALLYRAVDVMLAVTLISHHLMVGDLVLTKIFKTSNQLPLKKRTKESVVRILPPVR
ncbi:MULTISPECIES: hypothetical protein [Nostocales]|uniref:Uncharacterized protein n=3 Tax=Nostocales TaxID=1161 RepID=A0A8S9TBF4_9CYAN|nr:hypothetical protein [Tolypothrix bouteillei]KAF3889745.1 hypothetical protein DA73_0400032950 [Tolypothrix bouteillei VB521301]